MGEHRARLAARAVPIVLALLILAGCFGDRAPQPDTAEAGGAHRVVVIAPAAAEMLDALQLTHTVVGIGEFGPWPEDLVGLPVVGGYNAPNVERVLEVGANLVITAHSVVATPAHDRLEALGVAVAALDTSTYDGVFASLESVGRLFDREPQARALAQALRRRVAEVEARAAGLPRRSVLFVVGRDPLYVAGPGSHIDHLIRIAGGENVAHDALSSYQQVSLEAILEREPQVIIDTSDNHPDATRGREVGSWGRWEFLPAVQEQRVYRLHPSQLVIPGIRLPEMAELLGKLIHPETFGEPAREDYLDVARGDDDPAS